MQGKFAPMLGQSDARKMVPPLRTLPLRIGTCSALRRTRGHPDVGHSQNRGTGVTPTEKYQ
jgi:hypothetical protein